MPKSVEGLKQLADFFRCQAAAGVFDADAQAPGAVGLVGGEGKLNAAPLSVVLDGVGQQVDERLFQSGRVSVHIGQRWRLLELQSDATALRFHFDHCLALQQYRRNRHVLHLELQLARFDDGQVQDFIDQLQQIPAGFENLLQAALLPRRGHRVAGLQQLRKAQNGGKRRAQLVAHAGEKFRFGQVGFFSQHLCVVQLSVFVQQHLFQKLPVCLRLFALRDVREHHAHRWPVFGAGSKRVKIEPAIHHCGMLAGAHRLAGQSHIGVKLNPLTLQAWGDGSPQSSDDIRQSGLSLESRIDRQVAIVNRVAVFVPHDFKDAIAFVNRVEQRTVDFLGLIQLLFSLLAVRNVVDDDQQARRVIVIALGRHCHAHPKHKSFGVDHLHIPLIGLPGLQYLLGKQVMRVAVFLRNEAAQRLVDQLAARQAQQVGGFQVELQYFPGLAQRQVAHWRQVIQVKVTGPLDFQRHLSLAQLLVLHLQLNLVDLQLVQRSSHRSRVKLLADTRWRGGAGAGNFIGPFPKHCQFLFRGLHGQLPGVRWWQWHTHRRTH